MTVSIISAPEPPGVGEITHPTCFQTTGSVVINNLPQSGTWKLIRYPDGEYIDDRGRRITISGLSAGTYFFTVTPSSGCPSDPSPNVVINPPPVTLSAPLVTNITQPTCDISTGSVVLDSLPSGSWVLRRSPGNITVQGSGTSITISGLNPGTYTFTVSNNTSCTSPPSTNVVINSEPPSPGIPVHNLDCSLGFGQAVITVTSPVASGLMYRLDAGAYQSSPVFVNVINGSHFLSVVNSEGCVTSGMVFEVYCECVNQPTVVLSSTSGTTCVRSPITVGGNTFGGNATRVNITENGSGSVAPSSTQNSPFSFTYTPVSDDIGRTVRITVTSDNPLGAPCNEATEIYYLNVISNPSPPAIGTIIHPTCTSEIGSVVLSGLPASGTWILTQIPGGVTRTGTGTSYTATNIPGGTYRYTVTNSSGCVSSPSQSFVIRDQPPTPEAPSAGVIIPPSCKLATGSVRILDLPSSGSWTLTRYPGTVTTQGTGTSITVSDLAAGTYIFTVMNDDGCLSMPSGSIVIPDQPQPPPAPVVQSVIQPTYLVPTGSVELAGLPSSGEWIITQLPEEIKTVGSGTLGIITYLAGGVYTFTVTNSIGCTSEPTTEIVIINPGKPVVNITNPPEICYPATADISAPGITEGSDQGLRFTYWLDSDATAEFDTPAAATAGTYYIKGTTASGFFDIKPVAVRIYQIPEADAGPDQVLFNHFSTTMSAVLNENENGVWSIDAGEVIFADITDPYTDVSNLAAGNNVFRWVVNNEVCPADTDNIIIIVGDVMVPTLITPNGDTKNEYFVIMGLESIGKCELVIFDRRGAEVFRNSDYDNKWNGVDHNDNPLPNDTYFYILNSVKGRSYRGYIVIRR